MTDTDTNIKHDHALVAGGNYWAKGTTLQQALFHYHARSETDVTHHMKASADAFVDGMGGVHAEGIEKADSPTMEEYARLAGDGLLVAERALQRLLQIKGLPESVALGLASIKREVDDLYFAVDGHLGEIPGDWESQPGVTK